VIILEKGIELIGLKRIAQLSSNPADFTTIRHPNIGKMSYKQLIWIKKEREHFKWWNKKITNKLMSFMNKCLASGIELIWTTCHRDRLWKRNSSSLLSHLVTCATNLNKKIKWGICLDFKIGRDFPTSKVIRQLSKR
jgi:hypothetical protein